MVKLKKTACSHLCFLEQDALKERWPRNRLNRKLCQNTWSQVTPSLLLVEAQVVRVEPA